MKRRDRFLHRTDTPIEIGSARAMTGMVGHLHVTLLRGFTLGRCVRQSLAELVKFSTQRNDLLIESGNRCIIKTDGKMPAGHRGVMLTSRILNESV